MNENRRRILEMLAAGKISADEAERLLAALEREQTGGGASSTGEQARAKAKPKYMRVQVEADDHDEAGPVKVNVRIPLQLLHAGVKFTSLIPPQARQHVNEAFQRKGVDFDINSLKPENLDEIIDQLNDLTVDVDHKDAKVRVFCE
jgi:hypothetical protein